MPLRIESTMRQGDECILLHNEGKLTIDKIEAITFTTTFCYLVIFKSFSSKLSKYKTEICNFKIKSINWNNANDYKRMR